LKRIARSGGTRHPASRSATGGRRSTRAAETDRASSAATEAVQRAGNVFGHCVFDRDDFGDVFRRARHVYLINHFQHPLDVFGIVAEHEDSIVVNWENGIGQFCKRLEDRHHDAGLDVFNWTMCVT